MRLNGNRYVPVLGSQLLSRQAGIQRFRMLPVAYASATGDIQHQDVPARKNMRDEAGKVSLKNLRLEELQEWARSIDEPERSASSLFAWMYRSGRWITDATLSTAASEDDRRMPKLRKSLVRKIQEAATVDGGLQLKEAHQARDNTRKLVFQCTTGEAAGATIETVLIPMLSGKRQQPRLTICVSSQQGCAMNCQFCFTGRMGLLANLSTAQIVEQVVEARRYLAAAGDATPIGNIVFMGMGEPLHNLDAVLAAVDILSENGGMQFAKQKITVSTVGLVPEIRRFAAESRAQLAVSLHATTDEVRNWIAPINRKYNLATLLGTLEELYPADRDSPHYGRFVLIEYVMLAGVNDTPDDAARLGDLLAGIYCAVNLIVFNPHAGTRFTASAMADVEAFRDTVRAAGKLCTIRDSRGDDEMAACGQLGAPEQSPRPAPMLKPPPRFRAQFGVPAA